MPTERYQKLDKTKNVNLHFTGKPLSKSQTVLLVAMDCKMQKERCFVVEGEDLVN